MRTIKAIIIGALLLSGCNVQQEARDRDEEIRKSSAMVACRTDMTIASLDYHSGKEGRKSLSRCKALDDEFFIEIALKEIQKDLKDPSSVQYEGIQRTTLLTVDGKLNAKNSYGAYTGFKRFRVELSSETGKWDARIFKY